MTTHGDEGKMVRYSRISRLSQRSSDGMAEKRTRNLLNTVVCTALCNVAQAERWTVEKKEKVQGGQRGAFSGRWC